MALETVDDLAKELEQSGQKLNAEMATAALQAAEIVAGELREISYSGFKNHRTGGLARSWRARFIQASNKQITVGALSDLVYADILDRGGTIFPRTRKFLAIPLERMPIGKWPRHFGKDQLRLVPLKDGRALLVDAKSKGKNKGRALFLLQKSVHITARGYIKTAWDNAEPEVAKHLEDWGWDKMGGGKT